MDRDRTTVASAAELLAGVLAATPGPMGAVVFWTLLGVASARLHATSEEQRIVANEPATDRNLQTVTSAREV